MIQDPFKAYAFGWILSDKTFQCIDGVIVNVDNHFVADAIATCLHGKYDSKLKTVTIHNVNKSLNQITDECMWSFIHGLFDAVGETYDKTTPTCKIYSSKVEILDLVANVTKLPHSIRSDHIAFYGVNAIDFMGLVYKHTKSNILHPKNHDMFIRLIGEKNQVNSHLPLCTIFKTDPRASLPSKAHESDAGYDLTIIEFSKQLTNKTAIYSTGIKLKIEHGYYVEVVPRSSISKSGYMLANSVGIIDNNYNGIIYVALTKVDDSAPDLQLPFKCCQLIVRKQINVNMVEVDQDTNVSKRGSGGYGSTG